MDYLLATRFGILEDPFAVKFKYLNDIPRDILREICRFLDIRSLRNLIKTNSYYYKICMPTLNRIKFDFFNDIDSNYIARVGRYKDIRIADAFGKNSFPFGRYYSLKQWNCPGDTIHFYYFSIDRILVIPQKCVTCHYSMEDDERNIRLSKEEFKSDILNGKFWMNPTDMYQVPDNILLRFCHVVREESNNRSRGIIVEADNNWRSLISRMLTIQKNEI